MGVTVNTAAAGGSGGTPFEKMCPGREAVATVNVVAGSFIDQIQIACSTVAGSGLQGSVPGSSQPAQLFVLTESVFGSTSVSALACPNQKIGRGLAVRASALVDRLAVVCNVAELQATRISKVELSDTAVLAGTHVSGVVSLNGYLFLGTTVSILVTGESINVPTSASTLGGNTNPAQAFFSFDAPPMAASCPRFTFGAFGMERIVHMVITPPTPANATFSFSLVNPPASLTFNVATTINASVVFPQHPLDLTVPTFPPPVTVVSSDPSVVSVPTVPVAKGAKTMAIPMSALRPGCAVLSATLGGVTIRRTVRIAGLMLDGGNVPHRP